MTLNDSLSFYEILELKPDASPQEVREAYLRTKSAYNKDSVALYTLISTEEREDMLKGIESAYEVLSHSDRRKEYDRLHGLLDLDEGLVPTSALLNNKIISIDRVPPMENLLNSEDLLIAPKTDFTSDRNRDPGVDFFGATDAPLNGKFSPTPPVPGTMDETTLPSGAALNANPGPKRQLRAQQAALAQEIAQEVHWKGTFLRKIREARRISVEEMSSITKVSKTYILAIEDENFPKLPAAVFLRGFVTQIAKVLKLPYEAVVAAYMARFQQSRPDKNAR